MEHPGQRVPLRIGAALVLPTLSALLWLALAKSLSVSSVSVSYVLLVLGVGLGCLFRLQTLQSRPAKLAVGLVYVPAAIGWSWLTLVYGACSIYGDCL